MAMHIHRIIFHSIGEFIAKRPFVITSSIIIISSLLSFGNKDAKLDNDFRTGFTDPSSPSALEHQKYRDYYNMTRNPYIILAIAECIDGGSMLRPKHFMEMKNEIDSRLKMWRLFSNGVNISIIDLLAYSSDPVFSAIQESLFNGDENIKIGYPYIKFYGQQISTSFHFHKVDKDSVGLLLYLMVFRAEQEDMVEFLQKNELEWNQYLKEKDDDVIRMRLFGDEIINSAIHDSSIHAIPYFLIGATAMILFIFASISRYTKNLYGTLFLTLWTIFCPVLAGFATYGIYTLYGYAINSSMVLTPFLVLAVGVDDAFLMIHHWFRSMEVDSSSRLCEVLVDLGPSITLTSFTNICAFLIGGFLSPAALKLFCYCTALALILDWIFQIFVFAPCLLNFPYCSYNLTSKPAKKENSRILEYCKILQYTSTRCITFTLLTFYWTAGVYFTLQMHENFSPEKTINSNSHLANSLKLVDQAFHEYEILTVFVKELPSNAAYLLEKVNEMQQMECMCHNFPVWIEEYDLRYYSANDTKNISLNAYFKYLPDFLDVYPERTRDVRFEFSSSSDNVLVRNISMHICLRGSDSWRTRAMKHIELRQKIPSNLIVYSYDSSIFDIITSARKTTLQSCSITAITMIILCSIFIPNGKAACIAAFSVISINIGIVGLLCAWNVDMDVVAMISIVMAIGLTIDYAAHISYRYYASDIEQDNVIRMAKSIELVAYPAFQAAFTTMICILPLYFYYVYVYTVFAKTVLLCALLGFLHAIFVIPFFLLLH